jgi:hypothetical protein
VWTAEQRAQLAANADIAPFATGTADASNPGHVVWEGSFVAPATYWILVQSNTDEDIQYVLNIVGLELPAAPEIATPVTAIPNVALNIRTGPATTYPVIRTLVTGTPMTVLGGMLPALGCLSN